MRTHARIRIKAQWGESSDDLQTWDRWIEIQGASQSDRRKYLPGDATAYVAVNHALYSQITQMLVQGKDGAVAVKWGDEDHASPLHDVTVGDGELLAFCQPDISAADKIYLEESGGAKSVATMAIIGSEA